MERLVFGGGETKWAAVGSAFRPLSSLFFFFFFPLPSKTAKRELMPCGILACFMLAAEVDAMDELIAPARLSSESSESLPFDGTEPA